MTDPTTNSFTGSEERSLHTPTSDERTMSMLSHVLAIFFGFIPPLIIWLVKKDESKYVAEHAKESLNFQITLFIGYCICWVLAFLLIGFLLMFVLWIVSLIFMVMATIKASDNVIYRYPMNIRIIK